MNWPVEAGLAAAAALVASLLTWVTARRGNKNTEIHTLVTSLQALITSLQTRVKDLETRVSDLENRRREDAVLIRKLGDWIDMLEAHIWAGKGPPPPPRPEGL